MASEEPQRLPQVSTLFSGHLAKDIPRVTKVGSKHRPREDTWKKLQSGATSPGDPAVNQAQFSADATHDMITDLRLALKYASSKLTTRESATARSTCNIERCQRLSTSSLTDDFILLSSPILVRISIISTDRELDLSTNDVARQGISRRIVEESDLAGNIVSAPFVHW